MLPYPVYTEEELMRIRITNVGRVSMLFGGASACIGIASVASPAARGFFACIGSDAAWPFYLNAATNAAHLLCTVVRVVASCDDSDELGLAYKMTVLSAIAEFGVVLVIVSWGLLIGIAGYASYLSLLSLIFICLNMGCIVAIQWILTNSKELRSVRTVIARVGVAAMFLSLASLVVFGFTIVTPFSRPPALTYNVESPFAPRATNQPGATGSCAAFYANAKIKCAGTLFTTPALMKCSLCVSGDADCIPAPAAIQAFLTYDKTQPVVTAVSSAQVGAVTTFLSAQNANSACNLPLTQVQPFNGTVSFCYDPTLPDQDLPDQVVAIRSQFCSREQFSLSCATGAFTSLAPTSASPTMAPTLVTLPPYSAQAAFVLASNFTRVNPNGPFAYGTLIGGLGGSFLANTSPAQAQTSTTCATIFWDANKFTKVWKNGCNGFVGTSLLAPGSVAVNPGSLLDYAAVRFTASYARNYSVFVRFGGGHAGDTEAWVARAPSGTILKYVLSTNDPVTANTTFSQRVALNVGEGIDAVVRYKNSGNPNDLDTPLDFFVSPA